MSHVRRRRRPRVILGRLWHGEYFWPWRRRRVPDPRNATPAERVRAARLAAAGTPLWDAVAAVTGVPWSYIAAVAPSVVAPTPLLRAMGAVWFYRDGLAEQHTALPREIAAAIYEESEGSGLLMCRECIAYPAQPHEPDCELGRVAAAVLRFVRRTRTGRACWHWGNDRGRRVAWSPRRGAMRHVGTLYSVPWGISRRRRRAVG